MADGVKGLLIAKRLSLVVCAFASLAESLSTLMGSGGFSMRSGVGVVSDRPSAAVNWRRRASVVVKRSCSERVSLLLGVAIAWWSR